jgi:hypothetical protein
MALDAIEAANPSPGPHRLTHCYLIAKEEDRARFQELDMIADIQLAPSSVSKGPAATIDTILVLRHHPRPETPSSSWFWIPSEQVTVISQGAHGMPRSIPSSP